MLGRPGGFYHPDRVRAARSGRTRRLVVMTPLSIPRLRWLRQVFEGRDGMPEDRCSSQSDQYAFELGVEHADWLGVAGVGAGL